MMKSLIHSIKMIKRKPYLIIPKLIEQPTWGGSYIPLLKGYQELDFLKNKKIGQSYDLFGESKLATQISDSRNKRFIPELGFANKADILQKFFFLTQHDDYEILSDLVNQHPDEMLGKPLYKRYGKMPLLIKITQSAGNSFQLHIKPGEKRGKWTPKPESWYYLEDGFITFGIKDGCDLNQYKKTCLEVEKEMNSLSNMAVTGNISLEEARQKAKAFIQLHDPHEFVNLHHVHKHELVDLSLGGLHHSWEENRSICPLGNILYEIQLDVMDPRCTIRSFDQGKFNPDGTVRKIHIEDYFALLDTDPLHNDFQRMKLKRQDKRLLSTPHYNLDVLELSSKILEQTNNSFIHLYVREGSAEVSADEGSVVLTSGHSCFIPEFAGQYGIVPKTENTVILKTYIK